MKSLRMINFEKNYVFLAIFFLPVLAFSLEPDYKSYSVFVLISYAASYFICFLNPIFAIPFFILSVIVSPLWFNFSGNFIATNLAPLVYLIIFIASYRVRSSLNVLILCFLFLLFGFISFTFSNYINFLYPAMVNLIITTFLILVSFTLSENKNGVQSVNQLLVQTSFVCSAVLSLLIITSVWKSINLADFHAIGSGFIFKPDPYNKLLFGQSFFYNNIFFVLGIFVLIMFEDICFGKKSLIKVFFFSLGLIGFIFLLNKSA
ncbi:hypothetical protein OAR83_00640, partial [Alphaproteobacteria bacterium]|nr:hypothetical protein [Alphaproteobacteria bacterium]